MPMNTISPPDLEMRVKADTSFGQTRLNVTLHSPAGVAPFTHQEIAGPVLQASPMQLQQSLLQQIEGWGAGVDLGGALILRDEVDRKLTGLGRDLWRQLFTGDMRQAYRRFRSSVRSLLIISDEPWIPWEMVKPFDDEGEPLDDPFFAERFELTRWLTGNRPLPGDINVHALACITGTGHLPLASQEKDLVTRLTRQGKGVRDETPAVSSVNALIELLEKGGLGLLHFALHGTFDPAMPNEAGLPLADGSVFRPSDLHGPAQTQISQDRPMVVLNACSSGRQAWTWTELGGWADRWVRICGCGAFHWPSLESPRLHGIRVRPRFLRCPGPRRGFGESRSGTRRAAQESSLGNPSWLAYTVYGHPNARLLLGDEKLGVEIAEKPKSAPVNQEESYNSPLKRETFEQFVSDISRARLEIDPSPPVDPVSQLSPPQPAATVATSTNLRVKKKFSDQDRDKFVEDAFEFIASFFQSSLGQLEQQNAVVGTRFHCIDSDHFKAAVYVQGEKKSSCRIWLDKGRMGDIAYFGNDSGDDHSYHEALRAEDDGYTMWLRPSGLQIFNSAGREKLSFQEASEYFWSMLLKRLQ